ncbi:F-box protein [Corchorus olitorius]|uniref:F-box protein n=1 Tax=Corchorus olitorius TaxID=93759 RepID=A0A1R3G2A9_9ROSI|nr:F-box protein [Corchorus olitorius]
MEIYSSKTGSWKPSGSPFAKTINVLSNGVFWNGAIHWVSHPRRQDSACFDVEEEKFREIPMPTFRGDSRFRHYGESGGHFYLMEVIPDSDTLVYDLYEMERDYSGWFLKYKVDFHPIAAAVPEMFCDSDIYPYLYSILGIVQEESDDDSFLVLYVPDKAIRYNFKDGSFTMLHDFGPRVGDVDYFDACDLQFIESFASV